MPWLRKDKYATVEPAKKVDIPDGLWTKCEDCGEFIYNKQLLENYKVCPKCGYHFRLTFSERLALLVDPGTFQELFANLESVDPLGFVDSKPYPERIKDSKQKTGLREAIVVGEGKIEGIQVVIGIMDFSFLGGSMASVVGEKVARAAEHALNNHIPLVMVCASGGARMQEGIISLMQMPKTAGAVGKLRDAGIPYVSVLTHPTTGGVTASFASLGDVIIAEPKALIGFAGPRVIKQTIRQELPEGFQRAEFLLEHGMVDIVVERAYLKETVAKVLRYLMDGASWKEA